MKSKSVKKGSPAHVKPKLDNSKVGKIKYLAMHAGKKGKLNKTKAELIKKEMGTSEIVSVKSNINITNGVGEGKNSPVVQNGKKAKIGKNSPAVQNGQKTQIGKNSPIIQIGKTAKIGKNSPAVQNGKKAKIGKNSPIVQIGKKAKIGKNSPVVQIGKKAKIGQNSPVVQNFKKAKIQKKTVKQEQKQDQESDDEPDLHTPVKAVKSQKVGKLSKKKQAKLNKEVVESEDDDDVALPQSPEEKLGLGIEKILEKRSRGEALHKQKHANLVKSAKTSFLHQTNVTNAVNALMTHVKKHPKESQDILGGKVKFFFEINFIKTPQAKHSFYRIKLPNTLYTAEDDVCLFVADIKGKRHDPEETIDHYKELLKVNNINCVSEIIPLRKLTKEYSQYEQRRKLANRFEYFLVEGKISHRISKSFNRCFTKRKAPIPLRFDEGALKYKIEEALNKTALKTKKTGLTAVAEFGHNNLKTSQLVQNINTIANVLSDIHLYAGGSQNIRSIQIKTALSLGFPVFVSNLAPNEVKTPEPLTKVKKEPVTGELTTSLNLVKVFPDGTVRVEKKKAGNKRKNTDNEVKSVKKIATDENDSDEDSDLDSADESGDFSMFLNSSEVDSNDEDNADEDADSNNEDDSDKEDIDGVENEIKSILTKLTSVEDESSGEDDIEEAEQEFLKELRIQQDEVEKKAGGGKAKQKGKAPLKGSKPNKSVASPKAKGAKPVGKQRKIQPKPAVEKPANLKGTVQEKKQAFKTNKKQNKWKQNKSPKNKPKFEKSTTSPKGKNEKGKGKQRYFNAKKN